MKYVNMLYIHAMSFTDVPFFIILIKVSADIGPFSTDTDTTKDGRYLPIPILDHTTFGYERRFRNSDKRLICNKYETLF